MLNQASLGGDGVAVSAAGKPCKALIYKACSAGMEIASCFLPRHAASSMEAPMGRMPEEIACENCGRHERGMSPTLDDWLRCPYCRDRRPPMPQRKTLQRLFRIRPRRGADGSVTFERYE